jgi:hypothetical protein
VNEAAKQRSLSRRLLKSPCRRDEVVVDLQDVGYEDILVVQEHRT